MNRLSTNRLRLRPWAETDRLPFAMLNADPEVMRHFPKVLTKEESDATLDRLQAAISGRGWGFWAVEIKANSDFAGFVGLSEPSKELPFAPCVEIGWRLSKEFWGQGIATEAAEKALEFAFTVLKLNEVVSYTPLSNTPSRAVMKRIGLTNSGENFSHPSLPQGHPLAEHALYRISRAQWQALAAHD